MDITPDLETFQFIGHWPENGVLQALHYTPGGESNRWSNLRKILLDDDPENVTSEILDLVENRAAVPISQHSIMFTPLKELVGPPSDWEPSLPPGFAARIQRLQLGSLQVTSL
ncbi:hypothetical protein HGRIS_000223 [Hohenbuehelia grisea]|uniref:Uncharacterized protein n=1 Tax=Hohenbuehelia grisea TaxID=104357 RepID=A0ABR3JSG3_9AGAR